MKKRHPLYDFLPGTGADRRHDRKDPAGGRLAVRVANRLQIHSGSALTLACILYRLPQYDTRTHTLGDAMLELILVYVSFTAVLVVYGAQV
jgi:hypothetical protein